MAMDVGLPPPCPASVCTRMSFAVYAQQAWNPPLKEPNYRIDYLELINPVATITIQTARRVNRSAAVVDRGPLLEECGDAFLMVFGPDELC